MHHLSPNPVVEATESARRSGASVRLDVREGPCGWRSVVAVPEGAEIAFWQAQTPAGRSTKFRTY
jgi:predicted enzyme related to lactoylglutathione lyase